MLTLNWPKEFRGIWILTKEGTEKIESINNNILKRFLKTPKTTSKELSYMETGSTPISSIIDSRQILYFKKKLI